jgi:hypothetical protein
MSDLSRYGQYTDTELDHFIKDGRIGNEIIAERQLLEIRLVQTQRLMDRLTQELYNLNERERLQPEQVEEQQKKYVLADDQQKERQAEARRQSQIEREAMRAERELLAAMPRNASGSQNPEPANLTPDIEREKQAEFDRQAELDRKGKEKGFWANPLTETWEAPYTGPSHPDHDMENERGGRSRGMER